jgi:hypothetical protein
MDMVPRQDAEYLKRSRVLHLDPQRALNARRRGGAP